MKKGWSWSVCVVIVEKKGAIYTFFFTKILHEFWSFLIYPSWFPFYHSKIISQMLSVPSHGLSCSFILYVDSFVKSFCLELGYLKVQYWASSASCFSVLIFIFLLMWRSPNKSCSNSLRRPQDLKFSSSCLVSCAALCSVSLAIISYCGEFLILHLLYHFCLAW